MGPEAKPPSHTFDPPLLTTRSDLYYWHKQVDKWVDFIKSTHDAGQDRTLKHMFKILWQVLYKHALPRDKQDIFDEAQRKGSANYMRTEYAVKAVLDTVKIVAVDPPMSKVTQMIKSFDKIPRCNRRINESINAFADSSWGLPLLI